MGKRRTPSQSQPPGRWVKWLNSYQAVSQCLGNYDLEVMLDASDGLVRIENVLPEHVAHKCLAHMQAIPDAAWNDTSAGDDYRQVCSAHPA